MSDQATVTLKIESKAEGQGIQQTTSALQNLKGVVEKVGGGLLSLQGLVVGAFAAVTTGALGAGIKKSIDNATALREAAIRAGQGIEEFSALAGGKAGERTDALAKGARFLAQWMAKVGLQGQDLTQTFLDQADVIAKTTDGDERLRLATERFGRAGAELLPILAKGRAGLEAQMASAKALGLVIGPEFAQHSYEFNRNLKLIGNFGFGLFNALAESLLPSLLEISNSIVATLKDYSQRIRDFIQDAVGATIRAWKEGRLQEFLTLAVEVGMEEGLRLGITAGVSVIRAAFERLFSVDFLIFAATAGRILVNSLMQAVKIPIDLLSAGFEYVTFRFYNQWVDTNTKAAAFVLKLFTDTFNTIVKTSPALMFTVKPLTFDEERFRKSVRDAGRVDTRDFGDIFAEKQKESATSISTITGYFDDQIRKTKELITLGEASEQDLNKQLTARQKLIDLFKQEEEIRLRNAQQEAAPKPEHQTTKADLDDKRSQIEFQIQANELLVQQLHLRGQMLDGSQRTVSSLQEESDAIKAMLIHMEELARQRQKITDEMEQKGFISGPEARQQELKDAQELLRIQGQIIQLKEQTNDFTFFEKLKRNLTDLTDQFKHVGASIADVLTRGIGSAIKTVSDGIWQVIDGTSTWGQLFIQVGRQVISGLIQIAIQEILLDNLKRGIMFAWKALTSAFRAADVVESDATEVAKTPAIAANATLSSIESFGIAVAIGVAAIAGILAATGAFAEGGVIPGGEQLIRVNERGQESVLNANATRILGPDVINQLNAGAHGVLGLQNRLASNILPPSDPDLNSHPAARQATRELIMSSAPTREQGNHTATNTTKNQTVKLEAVFVDNRNQAREHIESSAGRAQIIDIVRGAKMEIGIS
jgi:hypothetical protein